MKTSLARSNGQAESLSAASQRGVSYYDEHRQLFSAAVAGRAPVEDAVWLADHLPEGSLIIDAGCGTGVDTMFLSSRGHPVYAYDASREMVEQAQQMLMATGVAVHHHRHDELALIRPVSAILASASLLFLEEADLTRALQAFARNLKEGGLLLASFKEGAAERAQEDGRVYHDRLPQDLTWLAGLGGLEGVEVRKAADVLGRTQGWLTFVLRKPQGG